MTARSNISYHLAILAESRILTFTRDANQVIYRLAKPDVLQLISMAARNPSETAFLVD
jgi:DNA-binding transcriptional ArsR family regulator